MSHGSTERALQLALAVIAQNSCASCRIAANGPIISDIIQDELARLRSASAEPVCIVYHGATERFRKAILLQAWLPAAYKLPLGEHKLYTAPPPAEPATPSAVEVDATHAP